MRDSRWEDFEEGCRVKGLYGKSCEKGTDFSRRIVAQARASIGRSHFVVCLPALQQFSSGGLHLVGIDQKEALVLVVCNLWRKV